MAAAGIGRRVEGLHATRAALAAGRVTRITVEAGRLADLEPIDDSVEVRIIDDVRGYAETTAPQGVVADCVPIGTYSLDALVENSRAAIAVLDHVEDPHNLGAAARSAAAASATGLIVPTRRSAPFGAAAFKAAAGALERLPVAVVASVADAVARLEKLGVWTIGLDATADDSLFGCDLFTEPCAVIVGAEGRGLSRLVRERVSKLVAIPMGPDVESLNASVSVALAMYEVMRVRASR